MNRTDAEQMLVKLQRGRLPQAVEPDVSQLADLDGRIQEVAMWCQSHVDLYDARLSLRPARLTPPPLPTSRWAAVDGVVLARRSEFERMGTATLGGSLGRPMVYFPDASTADGKAEEASSSFFDVHNAPPWGTWVGYFEDDHPDPRFRCYLFALVPEMMVGLATSGIEANLDGCIAWLRDSDITLRHIVEHTQLGSGRR